MNPVSREFTLKFQICGKLPEGSSYLNHLQTNEFLHGVALDAMEYVRDQIYGPITFTAAWVDLRELQVRNINMSP
jgi:hypothetical protein